MPLFKKNDRRLPSNYRPISLLSTVSKMFERVIFKHLHSFVVNNSLLYKYQSVLFRVTQWHTGLFVKLKSYGIDGNIIL